MKIIKSYKFRMYPTQDQVAMLIQHGGNSRFVWNKLLEFSNITKEKTDKYPTQSQLQKQIIQIKDQNNFIKLSHSQPIQINALRLYQTIQKSFKPEIIKERNIKIAKANIIKDEKIREQSLQKALNFALPKFKCKNKCSDSIFYPQNFIVKRSRIYFPKLKWINYIKHREIEGKPLFVTITKDGNQFYVSISCEINIKEKPFIPIDQANIIGIDVGLKNFATFSDGTVIENPRTLKHNLKKIKRESRNLKRKILLETDKKTFNDKVIKISSNNRNKQILILQKVHRKVKNIRNNFLQVTTNHIITKYDGIILENLDIKDMLKKNGKAMNRSIFDVSWYRFGTILEYKSKWNSKHFTKIDQYFASTQICNNCKNQMKLSLKDRIYVCQNCGAVSDRDINASKNIRDEGINKLKQNTVATTGIQVCGQTAIAGWTKQKKREFQQALPVA